jgi:hypothetical protein
MFVLTKGQESASANGDHHYCILDIISLKLYWPLERHARAYESANMAALTRLMHLKEGYMLRPKGYVRIDKRPRVSVSQRRSSLLHSGHNISKKLYWPLERHARAYESANMAALTRLMHLKEGYIVMICSY